MLQEMKEKDNERIELNEEQLEDVAGGAERIDWWNAGRDKKGDEKEQE